MKKFRGVCPPNHGQGRMTLNGQPIKHPDGSPVMAGDLVEGAEYFVNEDGVLTSIDARDKK